MRLRPYSLAGIFSLCAIVIGIASALSAGAGEIEQFDVAKGTVRIQTAPFGFKAPPKSWYFAASVTTSAPRTLRSVGLKMPIGRQKWMKTYEIPAFPGKQGWAYYELAATQGELDEMFPLGRYDFTFTSSAGKKFASVSLPGRGYPVAPRIINWNDLQEVESTHRFTVISTPFNGGTTNDYVSLEIVDMNGNPVFGTNNMDGFPVIRPGRPLEFHVPAGTLQPGGKYYGGVGFVKKASSKTNELINALAETGYFRITSFPIKALSSPTHPRVQLSSSFYYVEEGQPFVEIPISIVGNSPAVSMMLQTRAGTATGEDFLEAVVLTSVSNVTKIQIPIQDDFILESAETFKVSISLQSFGFTSTSLARTQATVKIFDNESPAAGVLQFSTPRVTVTEGATVAKLRVGRTVGSKKAVSVQWSTVPGTAAADEDFVPQTGVLEFLPGETNKVISINLLDDNSVEGDESFTVVLSEPTGGAALGAKKVGTVVIKENDVPLTITGSSSSVIRLLTPYSDEETIPDGIIRDVTYSLNDGRISSSSGDYSVDDDGAGRIRDGSTRR